MKKLYKNSIDRMKIEDDFREEGVYITILFNFDTSSDGPQIISQFFEDYLMN